MILGGQGVCRMVKGGKDSTEVIKFMALFTRLKEWCDDRPDKLSEFAQNDSSIKELCIDLFSHAHFSIKMNERRHRALFAAPVDPGFLAAWREYEERYEDVMSGIWLGGMFSDIEAAEAPKIPKADLKWDNADFEAQEQAEGIDEAINFANFNVEQDDRWNPSQGDFILRVQEGVAAWDRLKQDTGFDLRGIFRRRALIPFVLIPRHVAAKHGSAERLSLLESLKQAHDAFVYGATYAALALMRSIMEAVLRDHYGAQGKDLCEYISDVRCRLPRGASEAALHRLRKLANAILHFDREKDEGLPKLDEVHLEKEIVSLLFVLRALIEGGK